MVFGKIITLSFPVFLASGLRFAIASLLMLPLMLVRERQAFALSRRDLAGLGFMAFCGQFVFTVLVLLGLRYTSAIEAGIITATSPAMMVLVAFLLFRERPTPGQGVAVVLVVAGIISVNGLFNPEGLAWDAGHIIGNLMMVGAVLGEAFFLLMRKRIPLRISNLALTGFLCFAGFVMFLPLAVYQALSFDFSTVPARAWWAVGYFGAVFYGAGIPVLVPGGDKGFRHDRRGVHGGDAGERGGPVRYFPGGRHLRPIMPWAWDWWWEPFFSWLLKPGNAPAPEPGPEPG